MARNAIQPEGLATPKPPYSPVVVSGDTVYTAGQIANGPDGNLVEGGIEEQTRQTLQNVRTCVEAGGLTMGDVVKVNAYLADLADFPGYNQVYVEFFDAPYPARTSRAGRTAGRSARRDRGGRAAGVMSERDLVGYGASPPDPRWPGGARLALSFVLNYEEGGERSLLEGDPESESFLHEVVGAPPTVGRRNLNTESMFEYGSRAGFWRVHRIFTSHGLPLTVYAVGQALERNPDAARAMVDAGWEVASHGWRWIDYMEMPEDEEREHIRLAIEAIERLCGQPPVGWYTGRISANTRRLVVEQGGFLYDSDSYADELPYWVEVAGQDHLVIPYTLDINDMKFLSLNGFVTAGRVPRVPGRHLRAAVRGGRADDERRPALPDRRPPGRAPALDRFLAHVKQKPDVWVTTRADIARHWRCVHPPGPGKIRVGAQVRVRIGPLVVKVTTMSCTLESNGVTELNPRTGMQRRIQFDRHANALAWSEGYGDLWMGHFADGGVSRLHARTGDLKTHELVASQPASLVVQGDAVWVGDWATPTVVRLPTIGSGTRRSISLPALAKLAGSRPSLPGLARSGRPCPTATPSGASTRKPIARLESACSTSRGCRRQRRWDLGSGASARCLVIPASLSRDLLPECPG